MENTIIDAASEKARDEKKSNLPHIKKHAATPEVKEKTDVSSIPSSGEDVIAKSDNAVISTADELVTHVIRVEDDPTVSPWSFRMVFLGMNPADFRNKGLADESFRIFSR